MRVALVLPGQGSQRPGAGVPWRGTAGWELVASASQVLGRDVEALLCEADAEQLRPTREAQLATYLLSLVAARALPASCEVVAVAGHSLGDLTALVVAGVLTPERRAAPRRRARGRDAGGVRRAARHDGRRPRARAGRRRRRAARRRVAGERQRAAARRGQRRHRRGRRGRAAAQGGRRPAGAAAAGRRRLPHPADGAGPRPPGRRAGRRRLVATRARRCCPARPPRPSRPTSPGALAPADAPIRWRETLLALPTVDAVVECGPGGVLTGLVRRTLPGVRAVSVSDPNDLEQL